jgi:hypothetical protein
MKNLIPASGLVLLAGFAFFSTGCVAQYESSAPVPSYSGATLPAASTVALVMEFLGGEPSPEERADVRALLADYFSQQGNVLVDDTYAADYLVRAVLERRNPENPAEWTVVSTDSARTLRGSSGDDYYWPGGVIEDDSYATTSYSYIGFGLFYPVFFDLWSDPWHRGRVILHPPMRPHRFYDNDGWRQERRRHEAARWQPDRHPEWKQHERRPDWDNRDRSDRNRDDHLNRPNADRRPTPDRVRPSTGDNSRHMPPGGGTVQRPDNDRRPTPDHVRPPSPDTIRRDPQPATVQRPPSGGDRRPEHARSPQPEQPRPVSPGHSQPHVAPSTRPPAQVAPMNRQQPQPVVQSPDVRNERPRSGPSSAPSHGPTVSRSQPSQPPVPVNPPSATRVQPQSSDRHAGSPNRVQPGASEHRQSPGPVVRARVRETPPVPPASNPSQVRAERREPTPAQAPALHPREEQRRRATERTVAPAEERNASGKDRRPASKDQDKGNNKGADKDDTDKDRSRR